MTADPERYPRPPSFRQRVTGWRGRLAEPGWVLLPARLMLGGTFLFAGLQKLADPNFFDDSRPTSIQGQLAIFRETSPIGALLGPAVSNAVAVGVLTSLAEIAVGLGTLLGLWARVAAAGGFLLSLSFFLTVSFHTRPYYYGSDIFLMVMWLPLIAIGAGGVLSVDAAVRRAAASRLGVDPAHPPAERRRELSRRTLVGGGTAAAALAVFAGALAAASATLGRRFARDGGAPTAAATAAPPPTAPPTGAAATGPRIATAAEVPVGGAVPFTDPGNGQRGYVVQPTAGSYRAFNGTCSHAGCTVNFSSSDRRFVCPCHASFFDESTGAVLSGPAPRGLAALPVDVVDGEVRLRDS